MHSLERCAGACAFCTVVVKLYWSQSAKLLSAVAQQLCFVMGPSLTFVLVGSFCNELRAFCKKLDWDVLKVHFSEVFTDVGWLLWRYSLWFNCSGPLWACFSSLLDPSWALLGRFGGACGTLLELLGVRWVLLVVLVRLLCCLWSCMARCAKS